ncbi:MAG: cupin domain-containing protein [Rikenellaceae bacterium]|nr:cupin domain-containing protein [Rikenellaceae bacterium]
MAKNIGKKIGSIREAEGMSPEELSDRTGIDYQKLLDIESGRTIPSTAIVKKIVRALGIRLGTLLDGEENKGVAITRNSEILHSIESSSDGSAIAESMNLYPLASGKSDRQMEPFIVTLVADNDSSYISRHEGEEFLYVLDGKIKIKYGEDIYDLEQGDSIYFNSIVPHNIRCSQGAARFILVAYAPF